MKIESKSQTHTLHWPGLGDIHLTLMSMSMADVGRSRWLSCGYVNALLTSCTP